MAQRAIAVSKQVPDQSFDLIIVLSLLLLVLVVGAMAL